MNDKIYTKEAIHLTKEDISPLPKSVIWKAPANIALIKYWGKKGHQLHITPSLSMTLSNDHTRTKINYSKSRDDSGNITFQFNGQTNQVFEKQVKDFLREISVYFPFL